MLTQTKMLSKLYSFVYFPNNTYFKFKFTIDKKRKSKYFKKSVTNHSASHNIGAYLPAPFIQGRDR